MSDDLLTKEKEFHKLNQELQLKTHIIMKEINSIIYADTSNELSNNTKQLHTNFMVKDVKTVYAGNEISNTDKQSKQSSLEVSKIMSIENIVDTDISLNRCKNLGNKVIIKLLKEKLDMLHKKLQTLQLEYNKKCEYLKELEVKNMKFGETQIKLHNQIGSLNDTIGKLEFTNNDILSKYQALNNENIILKKDLYSLKKEIKILHKQSSNCVIRLNRSLENNERLRSMLKSYQLEEKELRNQISKLQEDERFIIKNLEKQQLELVQVFKKQILLIDNLKQQNIYLKANGQIYLTGEDFMKLLEWKPQ